MLFSTTTSLHNTMKMKVMNMKWQERKKDPFMPKQENPYVTEDIARFQKQVEDMRKSDKTMAIDSKLKSGMELTSQEIQYLKENSPELYEEYMDIKRERTEYKEKLSKCKTKEDVQRLNNNKMNEYLSTAKTISANANLSQADKKAQLEKILRRMAAITDEHIKFVKSREFAKLPTEREIDEEEKKKKKAEKAPEIKFEEKELKFPETNDRDEAFEWLKEIAKGWDLPVSAENKDTGEIKNKNAEGAKVSPKPIRMDVKNSPITVYSAKGAVKTISTKTEAPRLKARG